MIDADALSEQEFWEDVYRTRRTSSTGKPSARLVEYADGLAPGSALDLGCSHGDDVLWLARRGWQVLGVDISETALARARKAAAAAGLEDRARFAQVNLSERFPEGTFDLVTAFFVHSKSDFKGEAMLHRAARAVATGGTLLIVSHASVAPWSWSDPDTVFPTAEETVAALDLDESEWTRVFVGDPERTATGPEGQSATIKDAVVVLRRK